MAPSCVRIVAVLAGTLLAGCESVAYYAQALDGQLELARLARPLEAVQRDAASPQALRERLALAGRIREFASRELMLPDNDTFRSYAALGRRYVVWNVVAAPEFATRPVESCFPVAGCVAYRGFFAESAARDHADRLRAAGHDVLVYGVAAYSTLGWFADPLLSSFIHYPETELARLMFHELAHQVAYAQGDSTFNESFATVVEDEGVRRWLRAEGREATIREYLAARERREAFLHLADETRAELETIYRSAMSADEKRRRKAAAFAVMRGRYAAMKYGTRAATSFDALMAAPNNALLASFSTYTGLVPALRSMLDAEGGDLERFYARVRELAELDGPARERQLGTGTTQR